MTDSLRTAQILPSLSRASMMNTPVTTVSQADVDSEKCKRAMEMAVKAAPMYEGYMSRAGLYVGILGILNSVTLKIGE